MSTEWRRYELWTSTRRIDVIEDNAEAEAAIEAAEANAASLGSAVTVVLGSVVIHRTTPRPGDSPAAS